MQRATAAALRKRWPEASITIVSPRPDIDEAAYAPLPVVAAGRRDPLRGPASALWGLLSAATGRRFNRLFRTLGTAEVKTMIDADLVIDLSGDMLTEDYGALVGASHLHPLFLAWSTRTPFVVLAQSIGPFERLRPTARWIFNRAELVTAREETTADLLESYGWRRPDVTGDMAYLLEPSTLPPSDAEFTSSLRIGLSVSQLITSKYSDDDDDLIELLGQVIHRVAERHDASVYVVAHVTGPTPTKDDRIPGRRAAEKIGPRARCIEDDLDPSEIKALIGTCDVFVGSRMHANIAALTQAVPTLAISYSHKFSGIMKQFGQGDLVIEIEDLTPALLETQLEGLIASAAERRPALEKARDRLCQASERNIDAIEGVLL